MALDSFDDNGLLGLVPVRGELEGSFKEGFFSPCAHFANQIVSWISFVMMYFPDFPRRTCPSRKSDNDIRRKLRIYAIRSPFSPMCLAYVSRLPLSPTWYTFLPAVYIFARGASLAPKTTSQWDWDKVDGDRKRGPKDEDGRVHGWAECTSTTPMADGRRALGRLRAV